MKEQNILTKIVYTTYRRNQKNRAILTRLVCYMYYTIYTIYIQLIYIYISINTRIIDRHLSYRDLIESTIVHVLHDDIAIFDTRDNTNVSIVPIVSTSRKLNNWPDDRSWSGFYTIIFRISHPWDRIPSPCHILILGHIPRTIPSNKSSSHSRIFYDISILQSCFRGDRRGVFGNNFRVTTIAHLGSSLYEIHFWNRGFCVFYDGNTLFDSTRDHEVHTNTDTRTICKHIDSDDISRVNMVFARDFRDCISRYYTMDHPWNGRNYEYLSDGKLVIFRKIIGPKYCICTNSIHIWNTTNTLSWFYDMFFTCFFIGSAILPNRCGSNRIRWCISSNTNESHIWDIIVLTTIAKVIVRGNNTRFVIISRTNNPSRTNERERGIYRKNYNKANSKPLEFTKGISYWWNINIWSSCSCVTSLMIWTYGQSRILGIKSRKWDILLSIGLW